jgi:type II secretory pathway pseudopilin PulG
MMKKSNLARIYLGILSVLLLISIFYWIHFLVQNKYVVECFEQLEQAIQDRGGSDTSHTVSLPLTSTTSCTNFCGPTARCSISGQQCTADIDCPGCQPYVPPLPPSKNCVPGQNDAGKLTLGVTPTFSTLTTDIGTKAKLYTKNRFEKPAQANFGVNTWRSHFDESQKLFLDRYQCTSQTNELTYPLRYSDTGMFLQEGPLASNAYL